MHPRLSSICSLLSLVVIPVSAFIFRPSCPARPVQSLPAAVLRPTELSSQSKTSPSSLPGDYDLNSWVDLFRSQKEDVDYYIDEIEGTLPSDLHGSFVNTGPALFERGGQSVRSWLDGDGQVSVCAYVVPCAALGTHTSIWLT